ncbi:hypothetical protein ACFRAE_04980 [Sphingobacterium sp. HJSM2_6]|uniref:hypothetical protein n=1 Tax=Sphingobacterium sp. HJSM2_6 TaxID=3366264 RepID=UPI003BD47AC1
MKIWFILYLLCYSFHSNLYAQTPPSAINFSRQAVERFVFDHRHTLPLAKLDPAKIVGMETMHPVTHYQADKGSIKLNQQQIQFATTAHAESSIWFAGFNPFASYLLDFTFNAKNASFGFEFSNPEKTEQFFVSLLTQEQEIKGVQFSIKNNQKVLVDSIQKVTNEAVKIFEGKLIVQLLGSGVVVYLQENDLPKVIAQFNFNQFLELRSKQRIQKFQSNVYNKIENGEFAIKSAESILSTGTGLADIRAITYENGEPILDQGRVWYTMTSRGWGLPHPIQAVMSMSPTIFDLKLEGIIVFDQGDGLWRNEVASHLFYDRKEQLWKGITTGFSAYANPKKEKKQLLTIESKKDPRFGFSIMKSSPFGIIGDIEDPHLLFDEDAKKWRLLTCENKDGYKAILLESDFWNKEFKTIAGPVPYNSTGTSMQRINGKLYCFSGSSDRKIYIYSYPDLKLLGQLMMDLPPWDETSNTRVWPNVIELPEGYPNRYLALMMDRHNYPGIQGPNWTYGALYLYYGN